MELCRGIKCFTLSNTSRINESFPFLLHCSSKIEREGDRETEREREKGKDKKYSNNLYHNLSNLCGFSLLLSKRSGWLYGKVKEK